MNPEFFVGTTPMFIAIESNHRSWGTVYGFNKAELIESVEKTGAVPTPEILELVETAIQRFQSGKNNSQIGYIKDQNGKKVSKLKVSYQPIF